MKPETSPCPEERGTVPAGTLHWQSLPRVPSAVTSTQTMRDGTTFLHHNINILNCDSPEGSPFQRANTTTYSQVTPPVACSPAGSTTQLAHVPNIHPLALGAATKCPNSLLSRLLPSHMALTAVTPMGAFRRSWKWTQDNPFSQAQAFLKKVNLQAIPLAISARKHSGFAPKPISAFVTAPKHLPAAPGTAVLHPQGCVTLSHGSWGCCYTISVQTQGLHRMFIGYTCIAHAF